MCVLLDISTPILNSLTIQGLLAFDNQSLTLSANFINLTGSFYIGDEDNPFPSNYVATVMMTGR